MNGVLIIDKPAGLTSHDVVNRLRRILDQRSIGHLGTLDPMATGVLPLVVGSFTRLAQFYLTSEKIYEGTVRFGFSTDTYDAEGDPTSTPQNVSLNKEEVENLAANFRGVIEQVPPPFSAKKIKGVPAYKLARKQKEVVLKPVQVEIKEFEILSVEADRATFRARVGSGTYMRSVAHDMGQALGCGAHLESLRRTAVAEFTLSDAHTLEELAASAGKSRPRNIAIQNEEAVALRGEPVDPGREAVAYREPEASSGAAPDQGREAPDRREALDTSSEIPDPSREAAEECSPRRKPWVDANNEEAPKGRKSAAEDTRPNRIPAGTTRPIEILEAFFIHPRKLMPHIPSVTVDDQNAARIRAGRTVNLPELSRARQVKVFAGQSDLIAIATRVAGTLFHAKIVLCGTDVSVLRDRRAGQY